MARRDLENIRFGRLVAIQFNRKIDNGRWRTYWDCKCDCGAEPTILKDLLLDGRTKSCGCLASELTSKRSKTHGLAHTPTHNIWKAIKGRCRNPNNSSYKNYGARGIDICDEWATSFETFLSDMGQRPPGTLIERNDNSLGYCKDNCRWATRSEQNRNRRNCIYVIYNGTEMALSECAERACVKYQLLYHYYVRNGLTIMSAILEASRSRAERQKSSNATRRHLPDETQR